MPINSKRGIKFILIDKKFYTYASMLSAIIALVCRKSMWQAIGQTRLMGGNSGI
jgi:hypothetical protein